MNILELTAMGISANSAKLIGVLTVSLGLSLLQPLSAFAAPVVDAIITFNDSTDNLGVTVTGDSQNRASSICGAEISCQVFVSPPSGAGGSSATTGPLDILEPNSQIISDILTNQGFNVFSGLYSLTFSSDAESSLGTGRGLAENGDVQLYGTITWTDVNGTVVATDTIQFQSDLDPAVGVPEPISLTLFGAGLIGLGALRRRRNAKA